MKKNKTQGVAMQSGSNSNPECFISSRKNRLPIYKDGKVFLKNGQEFELELFNPTSKPIGAQIKINGQQMSSSMLVIRPGMRYFLDRFLDEARKLVFDTYMAENSAAGKAATALNGLVEVSFHKEKEQLPYVALLISQPPIGTPFHTTINQLVSRYLTHLFLIHQLQEDGQPSH